MPRHVLSAPRAARRKRLLPGWRSSQGLLKIFLAAFSAALTGCSANLHKGWADKDVYGIISKQEKEIFGSSSGFNIDTRYSGRKASEVEPQEILLDRAQQGQLDLSLADALKLAHKNSRAYQSRKEQLYLTALTLTGARHEFSPQFFANSKASTRREIRPDGSIDRSGRLASEAGFDAALRTGGAIGARIANDLLRYFVGDPRRSAVSLISLNIVQPLLRGAVHNPLGERLTQAEHDVIYSIRDFSHYQHTFSVDIVAEYWRLLALKDVVRNEELNLARLTQSRERAEALSRDRLPLFQVDQARQNELNAKTRYVLAQERFKARLDEFKITLGIPVGTEVVLDPKAMDELKSAGLIDVPLEERKAFSIAVQHRLDLLNAIDRFEDSKRKIKVAANALQPGLNLIGNMSVPSENRENYQDFNFDQFRGEVGVELQLPLDQLRERNDYRATLVNFESQIRALGLAMDDLRKSLRDDIRTIERARSTYDIQVNALALAERRVESAGLLLQAGRAQMRDLLDAQSSQVSAENAITESLINYHVARLELLNNLGVLKTEEDGFWLRPQTIPN